MLAARDAHVDAGRRGVGGALPHVVVAGGPVEQVARFDLGDERGRQVGLVVQHRVHRVRPRPVGPEPHPFGAAYAEHEGGEAVLVDADRAVLVGAVEHRGTGGVRGLADPLPQPGVEPLRAVPQRVGEGVEAVDDQGVAPALQPVGHAPLVAVERAVARLGQIVVGPGLLPPPHEELEVARDGERMGRPAAGHGGPKHLVLVERCRVEALVQDGRPVPEAVGEGVPVEGLLDGQGHRVPSSTRSMPRSR
ncbi:hypothetical protein SGRI78S_06259 [Streptomyces griseus subsp. griseus]